MDGFRMGAEDGEQGALERGQNPLSVDRQSIGGVYVDLAAAVLSLSATLPSPTGKKRRCG